MNDAAQVILAVGVLIGFVSMWLLVYRRGFAKIDAKLGTMHVTLEGVQRTTRQIDHAVNQRPHHEPTVSDDVRVIRAAVEDHGARLDAIEARLH